MRIHRAISIAALVGAGCVIASGQAVYAEDEAVLDGTYRLFFDGSQATVDGAPSPQPWATYWYEFQSSCAASGCTATGTQITTDDRTASPAFTHIVNLQFTNGQWVRTGSYEMKCADASTSAWTTQWSLTPQGDGTLTGTRVDTPSGTLCGGRPAGVISQPITATREG